MRDLLLLTRHYLRMIFRDRNSKLYGVLLPLVLYPAVLFLAGQGRLVLMGLEEAAPSRVLLALPGEPDVVRRIHAQAERGAGGRLLLLPGAGAGLEPAEIALAQGAAEAVLTRTAPGGPLLLLRREGDPASRRAAARVRGLAAALLGGPEAAPAAPLEVDHPAGSRTALAALLSRILPMILLVMAALGALHPAVEVTAGERERSTAETTLLLPVPARCAGAARLLAVGGAASLAVLLNLAGMLLAAGPLLGGRSELLAGLPAAALAGAALFGLLLALLFGGALLLACARARTFREAQAYATPIALLAFLPGLAPLLPGLGLDYAQASIPLVNAALALAALLAGEAPSGPLLLAAGQLLLLALLLGLLAARAQGRPEPALAEPGGTAREGARP